MGGWVPRSWFGNRLLRPKLVFGQRSAKLFWLDRISSRVVWLVGKRKGRGRGVTVGRGGGAFLRRGMSAGSSSCHKDISLFASIVPPSAETINFYDMLRNPSLRETAVALTLKYLTSFVDTRACCIRWMGGYNLLSTTLASGATSSQAISLAISSTLRQPHIEPRCLTLRAKQSPKSTGQDSRLPDHQLSPTAYSHVITNRLYTLSDFVLRSLQGHTGHSCSFGLRNLRFNQVKCYGSSEVEITSSVGQEKSEMIGVRLERCRGGPFLYQLPSSSAAPMEVSLKLLRSAERGCSSLE